MRTSTEWQTDRLLIRRFRAHDLDGFHELHGDPAAMHFIGGSWPVEKSRTVLSAIVANYSNTDLEWMAVTRITDGLVLGVCWLGRWGPFWRTVLPPEDMELGYRYRVLQKVGMKPQRGLAHQGVQARYYRVRKT